MHDLAVLQLLYLIVLRTSSHLINHNNNNTNPLSETVHQSLKPIPDEFITCVNGAGHTG